MIFVTGINGAAGRAVAEHALERGIGLMAISRSDRLGLSDKIQLVIGDLKRLLPKANLKRASGILHLAASRANTLEDDVLGDLTTLSQLLRHWRSGNFVFTSSQIVYSESSEPIGEDGVCDPVNWYAAGKMMSETLIQAYHKQRFDGDERACRVVFRLPLLLNAHWNQTEQALQNYVELVRSNRDFYWECAEELARSYGTSWIGEDDLASCLLSGLQASRSGVYNIQSGYLAWVDILEELIRRINSQSRIHFGNRRGVRMPHSRVQLYCSKCEAEGFRAKDNWREIVARFLAAD